MPSACRKQDPGKCATLEEKFSVFWLQTFAVDQPMKTEGPGKSKEDSTWWGIRQKCKLDFMTLVEVSTFFSVRKAPLD
jgi:hypothetical protein